MDHLGCHAMPSLLLIGPDQSAPLRARRTRTRERVRARLWPWRLDAAALLYDLADELARPAPVEARGIAQVRLLLRDGTGPLYAEPWPYLAQWLTRARDALCPHSADS
jgi:hypothetical protein